MDMRLAGHAQRGAADDRRGFGEAIAFGEQRLGPCAKSARTSSDSGGAAGDDDFDAGEVRLGLVAGLARAWIRVGTAGRTLAPVRVSRSSSALSSKRGSMTTWVPLQSGTFMQTVMAKMWKKGSTATTREGG